MAKISELPSATTLTGTELVPVTQAGETRKVPVDSLTTGISKWSFFEAVRDGLELIGGSGFNTISLPTVNTDTKGWWNAANNTYVIQEAGTYMVNATYRLTDGTPAGLSIGIGIDTANQDSPAFFWGVTNPSRNGIVNQRFSYFAPGHAIRLFAYIDGPASHVVAASMSVLRVR